MDRSKEFHVAIIGGGIAGLCLAIGLQKQQISYTIYEASSAFSAIGAGITIAPNGVDVMKRLHPSIEQQFLAQATSNGHGSRRNLFWNCRDGRTDDARLLFSVEGYPFRSIHRASLLSILTGLLPPEPVAFNKELTNLTQDDTGVDIFFADGAQARALVVVGCDGVHSLIRDFVTIGSSPRKVHPSFSRTYVYRGLVKMDRAIAKLGETLSTNAQNYVGNGSHIITYPIEKNTALNVVLCKYDGGEK